MAAAACYERKLGVNEVLMTGHQYHHHHHQVMAAKPALPPPSTVTLLQDYDFQQLQFGRESVLSVVAAAAAAATPAPSRMRLPNSASPAVQQRGSPFHGVLMDLHHVKPSATPQLLQEYTSFATTTNTPASTTRIKSSPALQAPPTSRNIVPGSTSVPLKDYSQPLHVDCSVEYELPSQVKPPPGNSEPLLMIHPCYYRRAERERRTLFVNNMPPRASSSSSASTSSSSTSRHRRSTKSASAVAPSQHNHQPPVTTGLMVNPMMPAPALAASTSQLTVAHVQRVNGMLPPSPNLASIVQDVQPAAAAAAAAATYQAALTAAAVRVHHPEVKQSHQKLIQTNTTEPDDGSKLLGLYNPGTYFSQQPAPRHPQATIPASPVVGATILHQAYPSQAGPQQPQSYIMSAPRTHHVGHVGSSAGTTVVVSHPYRRTTNRSVKSSTSGSAAAAAASYMAAAAAAAAAATNVYARQHYNHPGHHTQQMIYHQPQTAFYEAPVYQHHALLPQS